MAVKASFSAFVVVAVVMLFSIASAQDFEVSPTPAPSPSLERGFAVANSVGASAFLALAFSLLAFVNN
ncbi:hypothetical protein L484_000820 [Morus notabilis]|uniref:Uncharacterized protein n=1 Tax=Morus notabilis TaxID=981085 RepID=W9SF38_9ROSA|nr:hypothetical protein L484_000820 [Morus notabilis]